MEERRKEEKLFSEMAGVWEAGTLRVLRKQEIDSTQASDAAVSDSDPLPAPRSTAKTTG